MNGLRRPDGGNIAISLIGKNDSVRERPLHSGGQRRASSVRGFSHVDVEIKVCQYRASRRGDPDDSLLQIHLIDDLSDESMQNAVPAPRAIVKRYLLQRFWSRKYLLHLGYPNRF